MERGKYINWSSIPSLNIYYSVSVLLLAHLGEGCVVAIGITASVNIEGHMAPQHPDFSYFFKVQGLSLSNTVMMRISVTAKSIYF